VIDGNGWDYGLVFCGSVLLSLVFTPLALRFALRRSVLDLPGGHKSHDMPIPYLGGAAIVLAFALAVLGGALLEPPATGGDELVAIILIGLGLGCMGLLDDLRGLGPLVRLVIEILAGLGVWYFAESVQIFQADALNAVLTVVWIVGITNAFNLLDNMDGLSAGVAAIGAGFFFVIAAANGQFLVASLSIALAGCALGFLRTNFHPARIYMGDAGSLFLGFMLAAIGIKLRFDGPNEVTFFVPILVLGVAIFDTTLVTITRLTHRRSPLSGGRDHTSHRLVFVGLPVPAAVTLIYGGAVSLGWLGLITSRVDRGTGFLLMGLVLSIAAFVGVMLALVPVYETSRRRHLMIQEVVRHEPEPPAGAGHAMQDDSDGAPPDEKPLSA
jgi:UDP-GlcNAc:undecaprenyl-phosphate/decaprenyl-phosphate GlcNAc-1-phosphate transferase